MSGPSNPMQGGPGRSPFEITDEDLRDYRARVERERRLSQLEADATELLGYLQDLLGELKDLGPEGAEQAAAIRERLKELSEP